MPTLRSSSVSAETLHDCASLTNVTAGVQRDPVSLTDQKKQAENLKPKSRPAGRKRLRPVALADEPANEAAKIASGPYVAAKPAAVKKAKVGKALLTTLWTEQDLLPLKTKAERLYDQLNQLYKDPPCPLLYQTPFQLLVAVILSAQTTDKKVNEVSPALFELAPDAARMANMEIAEVQELIRQVGLAPTKAKNICKMSKMLMEGHDGVVPQTFEALEQLPGVGHKTASVVICTAFGTPTFPVDTHIHRLAQRWGLTKGKTVQQTEADLKVLLPEEKWNNYHLRFIYFGREHCPAQRHDPSQCQICSWAAVSPYDKLGSSPKKA
ncbi:hypothetical protein WJX77_010271 [Trebouxia sp. C0004]